MNEKERKKENDKKAVEYIQRLLHGKIPDFEVAYSFSNKGEKSGSNRANYSNGIERRIHDERKNGNNSNSFNGENGKKNEKGNHVE